MNNAAQKQSASQLTSEQQNLATFLYSQGYTKLILVGPLHYHGLGRLMFTWGLFCNLDWHSYSHRYCYDNYTEALGAYQDWSKKNFQGEPEGFIVRKP